MICNAKEIITKLIIREASYPGESHGTGQVQRKKQPEVEKEMATHPSILAWLSPRTEEPGGLQSMGLHD